MQKRMVPVEIAGYVNQLRYVRDVLVGVEGFRWFSVRNDNYDDDDFESWNGNSGVDDCPF